MSTGLNKDQIRELFDELDQELALRGSHADLFHVGGAAMVIAYDARRATRDLDAAFQPTDVVRDAAQDIAARRGLAVDWLNDAVKGFLPGPDPDAHRYYSGTALNVDVASARFLLAMKLFSARVEIDAADIRLLYKQLGFTTVQEGLDLVSTTYSERPVLAKVQFLLEEIVQSMNEGV